MDDGDRRRTFGETLFWCALIAGLGILAMRFLGNDASTIGFTNGFRVRTPNSLGTKSAAGG
jgi:hypothetical protein